MKRLLGVGLLLVIAIAALSSHGKGGASTPPEPSEPATTASESTSPAHHSDHGSSYTPCDQNISAGPHTTCGFSDNVFRAFAREVSHRGSDPADYSVEATSPATGQTYTMSCRTSGATTICSGARDARVRFPLYAAEVYYQSAPSSRESTPGYEGDEYEGPEEPEPEETETSPYEVGEAAAECTNGTYVNTAGNTVCSPEEAPSRPSGATAKCEDGTYSFSESRSGTCSHHGGVSEWLQ